VTKRNMKEDAGSVDVRKVVGDVVGVYVSYVCTKALWRWLTR